MARERYLIDGGEDTIHANVITADTPKEKRQNWWYYHKLHVWIGLIAAAIVGSIIYSIASKVQPDYTVALMTTYNMPENGMRELKRCLTEYADDRNGDGKVEVHVMNYVFSGRMPNSSDQYNEQQASVTRFVADISMNDSMIFLHDENSFLQFEEDFKGFFLYTDGSDMPAEAEDFENAMRPWGELKAFSEFRPETLEDETFSADDLSELFGKLRVSFRSKTGTSIEHKEKDTAYWQDSMEYYKRLEAGTPWEQE